MSISQNHIHNAIAALVTIALLVCILALVGRSDAVDASQSHSHYCAMVASWKADAKRGVSELDRAGWPPYDHTVTCKVETK